MFRLSLVSSLLLVMFSIWFRVALAQAHDTWHATHSPLGFSLRLPQGWSVETNDNGTILVHSEERATFALIYPFLLAKPETAVSWLRGAPGRYPTLFPESKIEKIEQRNALPDEAMASLAYRRGSKAGRANLLCSLEGRSGMFYAISSPQETFNAQKRTLVRILQSLTFTQPAAASASHSAPALAYTRWTDPQEGAFSLEIPKGWQAQGGLIRRNALDPRETVALQSPGGETLIVAGDATLPGCIPPSPALVGTGFVEGSYYSPGAGIQWLVARFQSGLTFGHAYLKQHIVSPYSDLQILSEKERTDLAHTLQSQYNALAGGLFHYQVSVGEITLACKREGKPMRGVCYGLTVLQESAGFRLWGAYPIGYIAPEGKTEVAEAALKHLVATWRTDPQWAARQSETALQVSKITSETHAQISRIINETYEHRQATLDDIARRRSNATLGLTDVRDPETGQSWKVAAGHNYYWRRGDTIVGNDTGARPDIDFSPLSEW